MGGRDTLTETFTVTSADGTEHDITVTINGIRTMRRSSERVTRGCGRSDGRHQLEHGAAH
ncbi:VCBS domain-containing protein [Vibrio chagasii]|nr:VCBS domain-containing protein [Vibrio chagasii]